MPTDRGADDTFDRLRPRGSAEVKPRQVVADPSPLQDREGKRALFSEVDAPPTVGSVSLNCHRCQGRSVVSWGKALRLAFPTVPALLPGSGIQVWMKCPTCGKRAWVGVSTKC